MAFKPSSTSVGAATAAAVRDEIQERPVPIDGRIVGQHRRRLDDRRYAHDANAVRGQALESSGEVIAAVAEVRAEPEIDINHGYSS